MGLEKQLWENIVYWTIPGYVSNNLNLKFMIIHASFQSVCLPSHCHPQTFHASSLWFPDSKSERWVPEIRLSQPISTSGIKKACSIEPQRIASKFVRLKLLYGMFSDMGQLLGSIQFPAITELVLSWVVLKPNAQGKR